MKPGYEQFEACDTASDDVCLIAFTSGTTGVPKGTMHFHRDMLAICDTFGKYVLRANRDDRFIGSPPIAFTFGLGGLVLFPLRVGAAAILLEKASPDDLLPAIGKFRATICFTAPTAYRNMLGKLGGPQNRVAAQMRFRRRDLARRDIRGLARRDRHSHHRRPRFDRNAARLHRLAAKRTCGRARPESRCPDTKRASSMRPGARFRPAPPGGSPCAARPAAAILATSAS